MMLDINFQLNGIYFLCRTIIVPAIADTYCFV